MARHFYFSLDSDVLSNLAVFSSFMEKKPNATNKQIVERFQDTKNSTVAKRISTYRKLLKLAQDETSKIRFLVTQTPWMESKLIPQVEEFIVKYCYTPKVKYLLHF